jgi:DNA-binding MarR family transcriptional regulator
MSPSPKAEAAGVSSGPLADLVGYHLRRASGAMSSSLGAALAKHGLSVVEASVLLVIGDHPGITQSEIGRLLDIRRANMAPLAGKLAGLGLTRSERRGRASLLALTSRGKTVARAARRAMERNEAAHLAHLQPAQREQLRGWLQTIWRGD